MEKLELERLRIAANQFYMDLYKDKPRMTDAEYDYLVKQYESEGNSVKDLVEWAEDSIINEPEEPLDKEIVYDNDLKEAISKAVSNLDDYCINLKYDGGGIKIIYDELGRLLRIQSTPDEEFGILRTRQFFNLVPHNIDPNLGIKCLRGEVVVDPRVYGKLARNKANGLINSVIAVGEINSEAFIRIYKITYFDDKWSFNRQRDDLKKLPTITRSRTRIGTDFSPHPVIDRIFAPAVNLKLEDIPTGPIADEDKGFFQCDGVVVYSDKGIKGYKFYYTDSAVTTVTDVIWNQKSNGSYAAVLEIDPVTLDDRDISRVSANGVPNLMWMKMGVGAKVRVILANTTIPKVIDVLKESKVYNFPKCKCGYQMSENDIYGSTLKCGNQGVCCDKVEKWIPECAQWIIDENKFKGYHTLYDCLIKDPYYIGWFLHIDRWNPNSKSNDPENNLTSDACKLTEAIKDNDYDSFKKCIEDMFIFSDLQYANMEINCASAFEVTKRLSEVLINEYNKFIENN